MMIPEWLAHLRTDRRGIPVPYINRWGPESTARLSIRHDPNVGMPALFDDDTAEPEPDFTAQNMQRQRACMVEGRCQVCGRPVPFSRRVLVVSGMSTEKIAVDGRKAVAVTEPWLCQRCAVFAVDRCPALIRRKDTADLHLVRPRSYRECGLAVSRGWVDGHLDAESKRVLPAMWVKVLLHRVEILMAPRPGVAS